MKHRRQHPDQLSLLEKQQRWSDLPQETRRRVVHRLARLLIQRLNVSSPPAQEPPHAR